MLFNVVYLKKQKKKMGKTSLKQNIEQNLRKVCFEKIWKNRNKLTIWKIVKKLKKFENIWSILKRNGESLTNFEEFWIKLKYTSTRQSERVCFRGLAII